MLNQYAIYQLKRNKENRHLFFLSWAEIKKQRIAVRAENYQEVYLGKALPEDTPECIWKRFVENPPKKFKGYSLSISDVIVYNKDGITTAYYVDKHQLYAVAGFFRLNSSSTLITMDTRDFKMEGVSGNWIASEEIIVDGRQFFLMENEKFEKDVAFLVVDAEGKIVTDDCTRGFDDDTLQKIRAFLYTQEQAIPDKQKKELDNWQKAFENGEYLRSSEIAEEQNYNMVDGLANNRVSVKKSDEPKRRVSVLGRLHQKQKEIAVRNGKLPQQTVSQEAERNRNRK